jgi:hypothetical protein
MNSARPETHLRHRAAVLALVGLPILSGCNHAKTGPPPGRHTYNPTTTEHENAANQATAEAASPPHRWLAASGSAPGRMKVQDPGEYVYYQSIWRAERGQFLVVLSYPGSDLGGKPYRVYVYDRTQNLLRRGTINVGQDDHPYALAEVRGDGAELPEAYRGKWTLAIAVWPDDQAFDMSLPVRAVAPGDRPSEPANHVYVHPVRWDDVPQRLDPGPLPLGSGRNVEFRWAEPHPPDSAR